jgi:hypothetical protein
MRRNGAESVTFLLMIMDGSRREDEREREGEGVGEGVGEAA